MYRQLLPSLFQCQFSLISTTFCTTVITWNYNLTQQMEFMQIFLIKHNVKNDVRFNNYENLHQITWSKIYALRTVHVHIKWNGHMNNIREVFNVYQSSPYLPLVFLTNNFTSHVQKDHNLQETYSSLISMRWKKIWVFLNTPHGPIDLYMYEQ